MTRATATICNVGLACVNGVCENNGRRFGRECVVGDAQRPCETGTVCIDRDECDRDFPDLFVLDDDADELCWFPQREGEPCDSEFSGTHNGDEGCLPCEPGLLCENVGGEDICVRECSSDDDCPCDTSGFNYSCSGGCVTSVCPTKETAVRAEPARRAVAPAKVRVVSSMSM